MSYWDIRSWKWLITKFGDSLSSISQEFRTITHVDTNVYKFLAGESLMQLTSSFELLERDLKVHGLMQFTQVQIHRSFMQSPFKDSLEEKQDRVSKMAKR